MIDVKEQLKDIPIRDVVERLGGLSLKPHGTSLQGDCPTGHESEHHKCFSVNLGDNYYHCFSCGIAGDIISLVELVKGVDFREALKWLAQEFKPELLPQVDRYKGEQDPRLKAYYQKADLYSLIYDYGKALLYEPRGKEALDYLTTARGYEVENVKQTEWIYYPPDKELRACLATQRPESKEEIDKLRLHGYYGDNFRLAFPYRDRRGAITGFLFRATAPQGITVTTYDGQTHTGVRYDSLGGTQKEDLFNLNTCKGYDELVIVEGCPDALYLPTLGLKNVVAVGQGLLSKSHIQGLQAFRVKRVILSFDNDRPKEDGTITGVENTEKALDLLKATDIRAFVIDPPLLSPHKDPDEFVRAKGIEAYKALVGNPTRAGEWVAKRIAGKEDLTTAIGRDRSIDRAIAFEEGITNPLDSKALIDTIADLTDTPIELIEPLITSYHQKKAQEKRKKDYGDFLREGERLLREGKVEDIPKLLDERYKALTRAMVTVRDPFYPYESLQSDLSSTIPGLETGFKDLDQYIRIPQEAITIVAARPSHGKTTFLMNLLVNLVKQYHDKHFFFFSYEENRKKLAVKLINILAGVVVAEDLKGFNVGQIENYIRGNNKGNSGLDESIENYNSLVASHRLGLTDEHFYIDELTGYIASLTEKYDTGAILIDYIQKVKSKGHYQIRQLEIQDVSRQLLETSLTYKVPIVLGAQFNRQLTSLEEMDEGKLRKAGDIEQDANLVLGLWCEAKRVEESEREKQRGSLKRAHDRAVDLDVLILKHRDGVANRRATLTFDRPALKIKDKDKTP